MPRIRASASPVVDGRFRHFSGLRRTTGINGKDAPSVRMRIGIALRQVRTSAFSESARLNPGASSRRLLVQSPNLERPPAAVRTIAVVGPPARGAPSLRRHTAASAFAGGGPHRLDGSGADEARAKLGG
jgi:hypothetical protein